MGALPVTAGTAPPTMRSSGVDYFNRTGTAKSNMFDNKPNETQYFYTDYDSAGTVAQWQRQRYEMTFAPGQEPPVNGFWSLTLYNEHHFFHPNDLEALFARNEEQGARSQRRRIADDLCEREIAGGGQGGELAACARWSLFALHPRLLGPAADPRRHMAGAEDRRVEIATRSAATKNLA